MLFSVIIPVYNVEKYLEECLESVVGQASAFNTEILLIDDGSTDKSGVICDRYALVYPDFVRVFHKPNQGLLLTRRFGYERAKGDYIINLDSDDTLESGALEALESAIERERPDMILYNYSLYDGIEKSKGTESIFTEQKFIKITKQDIYKEFLVSNNVVSICIKCFRRDCLDLKKDYLPFSRISNGEDSLQTLELLEHANKFIYLNEALYNYRMESGMTAKFDANYYTGFKTIVRLIEKEKDSWNLEDYEERISIKVLFTAARAITQSRFGKWENSRQHREFLEKIEKDDLFRRYIPYLQADKQYLQKDHYILLKLLKNKQARMIIWLLQLKNRMG